jgi:hypothetical protein
MRSPGIRLVLLFGFGVLFGSPGYAQNKTACQLLSKADAEGVLGVTLQPPKPTAPLRSLLDALASFSPQGPDEITGSE